MTKTPATAEAMILPTPALTERLVSSPDELIFHCRKAAHEGKKRIFATKDLINYFLSGGEGYRFHMHGVEVCEEGKGALADAEDGKTVEQTNFPKALEPKA